MSDGEQTRATIMDVAEGLILERGFSATSVDSIVEGAGVTKGAFFHHFTSKGALARALVDRYAEADRRHLEEGLARAERLSRDPLQQLLIFVALLEETWEGLVDPYPGCLFASYLYEAGLFDQETHGVIRRAILAWRDALAEKLREAACAHPPRLEMDPDDVADQITVVFEGAFVLSKTLEDAGVVARQIRQYRNYLELLFGVELGGGAPSPVPGGGAASSAPSPA